MLPSYVAKMFLFRARFARVMIVNTRHGGSRQVLVSCKNMFRIFFSIHYFMHFGAFLKEGGGSSLLGWVAFNFFFAGMNGAEKELIGEKKIV